MPYLFEEEEEEEEEAGRGGDRSLYPSFNGVISTAVHIADLGFLTVETLLTLEYMYRIFILRNKTTLEINVVNYVSFLSNVGYLRLLVAHELVFSVV